MNRWALEESQALTEIRTTLKDQIFEQIPFPEVVGDRRLLRFYYGNNRNLSKTIQAYSKFLSWRKQNNVDKIRQDILYGGAKSPMSFPYGSKVLSLAPQIVFSDQVKDKYGNPLVLEAYNFKPSDFFDQVSMEEYLIFLMYCLEYRSLCLEQLSEMRERKYLESHKNDEDTAPYGVIQKFCNIRDLKGISTAHLGQQGRIMVTSALAMTLPNYPDSLEIGYFINVPWVFNAFWFVIRKLLDESILRKLNFVSTDYMKVLLENFTMENIPDILGGQNTVYNQPFEFDVSETGPLWYDKAPKCAEDVSDDMRVPKFTSTPKIKQYQPDKLTIDPTCDCYQEITTFSPQIKDLVKQSVSGSYKDMILSWIRYIWLDKSDVIACLAIVSLCLKLRDLNLLCWFAFPVCVLFVLYLDI